MEFRILGPLEVWDGDRLVPIDAAKQRALLALLLLNVGRVVAVDQLVDELWGERPPAQPRATVQAYVHRLRQALRRGDWSGAAVLDTRPAGYQMRVPPDGLDRHRWQRLVTEGQAALADGHPDLAVLRLRAALALWRGPALADVVTAAVRAEARGLDEHRLEVLEQCLAAELGLGRHAAVLPELETLVTAHPYREGLAGKLMVALSRVGRRADALAAFARARGRLAGELGLEPGAKLQELHQTILRGEPDCAERQTVTTRAAIEIPAQLPSNVYGFTGRTTELDRLDRILAGSGLRSPSTVIAVTGTAGVGKTTLAVQWAHRVADHFPDGQLYVNLRGFAPDGAATSPAAVVRGFLDAFGVASERVPGGMDAQAALYRSLVAGRRVLVVLDNARDGDQVRPLLPGSAGCLVVVTSRNDLSGLVAAVAAHPLHLNTMTASEARQLLATRLRDDRVAAEPEMVRDIVTLCARLPLALAVVAARAAARPGFPLRVFADELRSTHQSLDALNSGDLTTDVRSAFSWSYRSLGPAAARLFRLLGLHPGPDISTAAAASLIGAPVGQALPSLRDLARANLVVEHVPGRYALHDLLRAYALELLPDLDSGDERQSAVHRMLDHYLHTGHTAALRLDQNRHPISLATLQPGATPEQLADHNAAVAWLTAEYPVLQTLVRHAPAAGRPTHCWQLAWTVEQFIERRGYRHDQVALFEAALDAARLIADRTGQAHSHRGLGRAYAKLGRYEAAADHLQHALKLFRELGERACEAHIHVSLGSMYDRQGRHEEALGHSRQSLTLFESLGDVAARSIVLSNIGWLHTRLGDHLQSRDYCEQALSLIQQTGDRLAEAHIWHSLGHAHHHLGDLRRAVSCYRR
ncbi:AfsR/SARP family transcriptional regulator, partial [Plantactinospora mayteni]